MAPPQDSGSASKQPLANAPAGSKATDEKLANKKDGDSKEQVEELSEEDQRLSEELELLVTILTESDESKYEEALNAIKRNIKTSTSSMTAVPKPLKFLRPKYDLLTSLYESWGESPSKKPLQASLADVISVLAMTQTAEDNRDILKYRLLHPTTDIGSWGHEYLRHLALQIGKENDIREDDADASDLHFLAESLVPLFIKNNAETDAVDTLSELDLIEKVLPHVDKNNYKRFGSYITSLSSFFPSPRNETFLLTAFEIYIKCNDPARAMVVALKLHAMSADLKIQGDSPVEKAFNSTNDKATRLQLAFLMARQRIPFNLPEDSEDYDQKIADSYNNSWLFEYFQNVGKELDIMKPKVPEDIYKSHLITPAPHLNTDPIADSFVSGLVNIGFGKGEVGAEPSPRGSLSQSVVCSHAALGLIHRWDCQGIGSNTIVDNLNSSSTIKGPGESENDAGNASVLAGSCLGFGIMMSTVISPELAPTISWIGDYIKKENGYVAQVRSCALLGLGISLAGTCDPNETATPFLTEVLEEEGVSSELYAMASLALGLIYVGSSNKDIALKILRVYYEKVENQAEILNRQWFPFLALGAGLIYLGQFGEFADRLDESSRSSQGKASSSSQEGEETADGDDSGDSEMKDVVEDPPKTSSEILDTLQAHSHPSGKLVALLIECCAWAGSGNVIKIQEFLQICNIDLSSKDVKDSDGRFTALQRSFAVIGISLVGMGEQIGRAMCIRHMEHLMHYGPPEIRRAVPLALGLLYASDPQMKVYETLSTYTHDGETDVAMNAILAIGLVGAGTNHARLAGLLRQLLSYYRDKTPQFITRFAQGLLHLGKGMVSLNPFHTDREIMSPLGVAGLLSVVIGLCEEGSFVLEEHPHLLLSITPAIYPRFVVTLDEELSPVKVNVRVGAAVDVTGQAGQPRTITGWQTQSTPVLLAYGERAELEDDKYICLSSVMEGIVILRQNPEWKE